MGVKELRVAFNAVAEPKFSASRAYLSYERRDDAEWQRITFSGRGMDGLAFEVRSEPLATGADVEAAARGMAQRLIDEGRPVS